MENDQSSPVNLDILDNIISWFGVAVVFAVPLFFLPLTADFFDFNKMYLVFTAGIIMTTLVLLKAFIAPKLTVSTNPLILPIALFNLALIASSLIAAPNHVQPFLAKTGIVLSLSLFFWSLLQSNKVNPRVWLQALVASSFILSWVSIFSYTKTLPQILPISWAQNQNFSPAGSIIALVSFQLIVLPLAILLAVKTKSYLNKVLYFASAAVMITSIVVSIYLVLPGKATSVAILPLGTAWWIAVELFKTGKTALFGVGPENYVTAFNLFRPVSYNTTPLWQARFGVSSNEFLQILTTTGLLGLLTLGWLLLRTMKTAFAKGKGLSKNIFYILLLLTLILAAVPAGFLTYFSLFVLIATVAKLTERQITISSGQLLQIVNGLVLIVLFSICYFAGRAWNAELVFKNSLDYARANKGLDTYNATVAAIKLNPFAEKYRLSFANINLALASTLSVKKDLTSADRDNITQLISQGIAEGKSAISLNPANAAYWENLAGIYRNLINSATGADNWTLSSLMQAGQLDPTNPNIPMQIGSLLYSLGRYDEATNYFRQVISLKPDYANAYYNLSYAFKQKGDTKNAFLAMQQVVALISPDSADFSKANKEMEELRGLLPESVTSATASANQKSQVTLTPPQPLPSPATAVPVQLPKDVGPAVPAYATASAKPKQ